MAATFFITSFPPTGQNWLSRFGALTAASANARQPAKPQPPQLAPGITFSTSSMRGSSSTLNFFAMKKRTRASSIPRTEMMTMVQIIVCVIIVWLLVKLSFYRKNVFVAQPVPEKPQEQIVQRYAGDRSKPCRQLACPEGKRAHQYHDQD